MARSRLTLGEPSVRRRLLTGGTIWSGAACSPHAGWVLVEDDRITAVGEASESAAALPSPIDERLDLSGCHVLPGFVDVHLHLSQAAWFPLGVDGLDWASPADCLHAVRVQAAADPAAPWLLSWRVARWRWPEGRLPTADQLDEAAPGRNVLVSTLDMHRGAVSAAGLATLGLASGGSTARFGSDISSDRRGRPTGELWEAAYTLALQRALTDLAAHTREAGTGAVLEAEAARLLAHGITHAHDPYVAPDWHGQMLALRAGCPIRLSWATGDPAGMQARPPGPGPAPEGPYGDSGREVSCSPTAATAARCGCRRGHWLACSAARSPSPGGYAPPGRCARGCAASWPSAPATSPPPICATPTPSSPAWSATTCRPGCGCASTRSATSPAGKPRTCSPASACRRMRPPSTICCCLIPPPPSRSPPPG